MSRFPLSRAFAGLTGRSQPAAGAAAGKTRPPGRLVWVHVAEGCSPATLEDLGRTLAEVHPVSLLVTGLPEQPDFSGDAKLLYRRAPEPGRAGLRDFLFEWRPDIALWVGTPRDIALLTAMGTACPTTLVAPGEEGLAGANRATRAALRLVSELWVGSAAAAGAARAAGVGPTRIRLTGPLVAPPAPPPCIESDRADLAERLSARPVWLAARPLAQELGHVLAAHRAALAIAHRAILLLVPGADCPDDDALAVELAEQGLTSAFRARGEEPLDTTEVYVTDRLSPEEDGLWFRLAPLCFLGGTLTPGGPVQASAPAAALGSAITFGPHGGGEEAAIMARLAGAGAARALANGEALPSAVAELLAPDRAAELAAAAWTEISEGAAVIARLAAHLATLLDTRDAI
ncbi:hypothetical protein [Vannielia litorea]|uniref:3-deoxy-D-manno-octulosonic acid transferase n=1 Tax=Vannielia litorea TaxID=1217970 RepID=A0A1N6HKS3_9RHOB|nr:hypothetical protein [Vannielia litorea]SIO20353.1 3-deoxy-D-manno-octulosonic-acid transferase [Vannielia litorea]